MSYQSLQKDIEAVCSHIDDLPQFAGIEILKTNVHRERGTFFISLIIDREGGVDTNLCEAVARSLERRLESLPPPIPLFTLEVASAGLARPLLTPQHYRRFSGKEVNVITTLRIRNRVEFTGTIADVAENVVTVDDKYAGLTQIPYQVIKRANLVYHPEEDLKKAKRS